MQGARFLYIGGLALAAFAHIAGCPSLGPVAPTSEDVFFNLTAADLASLRPGGEPAVFHRFTLFEQIEGRTGHHAPTLAALPDGGLLAAWFSYRGPNELDGAAIYMARRENGDTAWSAPSLHIDRWEQEGNPVLYAEGERLWLFFAVVPGGWSTARIEMQTSGDAGQSWAAPRVLDPTLGANVRFPPIRTCSGELLLPAYSDLFTRSVFYASADGLHWTRRGEILTAAPNENLQPSIVALMDGAVVAVMRNAGRGWLWAGRSGDSGRTWRVADAGFPNPGSPAALLRLRSGNLLMVFNDSDRDRRPLSAAISPDDGRSWTPPRALVEGEGSYAYPAATQTGDGRVHVLFSDDRRTIGHVETTEAWIARVER